MKLFQQLLVAGASLSLIAPIAAQASSVVNLEEMNSYARSSKKSSRIDSKTFINQVNEEIANLDGDNDSLQVEQNQFEAGSFSDTTTLDSSVVFAATAIDGANKVNSAASDDVQAMYTFTMNLNTSFTGDDNLYVRLRTGNGKVTGGSFYEKTAFYHTDTYSGGIDGLKVDKIWYTTPIGDSEKWTAFVGPKIENYYMYAAPVSIYRPGFHKAFKLGSLSGAFGASTATGVGVKYSGDNGFAVSSNIVSKGAAHSEDYKGFLTDQDEHKWDTMLAYTQDQYHVSLTVSQQHNDWTSHQYYATTDAGTVDADTNATAWAARAYWRPQESGTAAPEVSVGYDIINYDGQSGANKVQEATSYFVGLGWPDIFQESDYIGLGFGQPLKTSTTVNGDAAGDADIDPFLWEASYSFKVNDSITMIPAIFGGMDIQDATDEDFFGAALTTKFKF
tara:strand:- start:769 stop:2109 length:1341 start_codon:yes stop_codon:yes gene_type:complete